MRVLAVSEGKHEQAGALENLLRRLGGERGDFVADRVANPAIHAHHGKGHGYFKRAVRWLLEAEKRGVDALVLLIDQDGDTERSRQMENAQTSALSALPRAMGVAIRTFDAWMLADERALTEILGCTIPRQPDPEAVRDPKSVGAGLLADGPNRMAQREMYAQIAHRIEVEVLSARCPTGFRRFAGYVRRVFEQET